jgi:hypothetical protein
MIRHLFWASVILCALAGGYHTAIGLLSFEPLSAYLAWYLDAGLAMLLLALANWAVWSPTRHPSRAVRLLTHVANFLMALFGIVGVSATGETRMYIGLVGMVGLFVTAMSLDRAPKPSQEEVIPANPS